MWDSLIGVKSSDIFAVLYYALKGRVGGERGRELDVSCGVRELTEWVAQRGHMELGGGKYEASPQTDWAKVQQRARNTEEVTECNTT